MAPETVPATATADLPDAPAGQANAPGAAFAPNSAPDPGPDSGSGFQTDALRSLDRRIHATLGSAVGGLSVVGLAQAWSDWALHLALSPGKRMELGLEAWRKWSRLGTAMTEGLGGPDRGPCIVPRPNDRRFAGPAWHKMPYCALSQSFLLAEEWWHEATTDIPGVSRQNERLVEFYGRQFMDMLSPSNFLATNPELMERTAGEGGKNLIRGLSAWAADAGRVITGDDAPRPLAFRPGKEVAITPGEVIYQNRLIELIQYRPATETVQSVPILIVPAWIMKYYILDLSPENSLIRWLVGQGFTVFCLSWKNPDAGDRDLGLEDYRTLGVMAALDAVCAVTGAEAVHAMGYCLGGTLLAVAAAAMARDGDRRLATLTLLAAQVDFSQAGELAMFASEPQIALLEDIMWQEGYLDQRRMAGAFNMLRAQDLIWSRVTKAYLEGEIDRPDDLGSWSMDATRMPYRMHSEYLRRFYLDNDLSEGRLGAGGAPVYLADIRVPIFAVATERDHIAPWKSVFKLSFMVHGALDLALVSGGHNTGIVAPPGHPRASYRLLRHGPESNHPGPDDWAQSVAAVPGSWWEALRDWWLGHSDRPIAPPPMGRAESGLAPLRPAPGNYVLMR